MTGAVGASGAHPLPNFNVTLAEGPARSFCLAFWGGLKDGSVKVDSANRPNGLRRVTRMEAGALRAALWILLSRYPVLNSRVEERGGAPWLIPLPANSAPPVTVLDHGTVQDPADRASVEEAIGALVWRPMDLQSGPLYRAYMVGLGQDEAYIGLVAHHFIADSVSIGILLGELHYIFELLVHRMQPRLPPPGLSYGAYLQVMTSWIESDAGIGMMNEVIDRMTGLPQIDLTDRLEPDGAFEENFLIDVDTASKIRSTARALGAPPFTVLLAVQNLMLLPYCSEDRVPIKVITDGRELSPLLNVVGNLADRMIVLSDLAGCSSFADVVRRTQTGLSWSRRRALVRHELILAAPAASGLAMAAPVFNFRTVKKPRETAPAAAPRTNGLRVPPVTVTKTRPRDAYYLVMTDTGEEMTANIRYGSGRIVGFVEQFTAMIEKLCTTPDAPLDRQAARPI